jgi:putative ABC transport system ATP-binding protein
VTLLRAEAVEVRYGDTIAVGAVSLTVDPGELVAVTGPSGAGKTSLLSALAGRLSPAAGTVELDGAPLASRDAAARRGIALVPQGNALVRVFTAAENVAVAVGLRRPDVPDVYTEALALLSAVGLEDAGGQLVEQLSGGQQQRTAVARALGERGRVVIADEPTSELDTGNRDRVMALLRAEAERGAAVVVATHDPEAAALCDAELRLDEGVAVWVRDDR